MRTLNLNRSGDGLVFDDPLVAETSAGLRAVSIVAVQGQRLTFVERGESAPTSLQVNGALEVAPDGTTAVIPTSDGTVALRRVTEDDGSWLSALHMQAPVDSLEQLVLGGPYMSSTPFASNRENLWAAVDTETDQLVELVYSSPTGDYVRASGGWFKLPADSDDLDGLESIDVNSDAVAAVDAAEAESTQPTRDDLLAFAVDEATPETSVDS